MDILIFEDGKIGRSQKAKFIKKGNKRVLIEFFDGFNTNKVIRVWFKAYAGFDGKFHDNKRKSVSYCHDKTNMFYRKDRQTAEWRAEMKECLTPDYFNSIFT